MSKKLTLQECIDYATSKNGICLSVVYISNMTPMLWKCHNPEHEIWEAPFGHIKRGRWCPSCAGRFNNSIELCREIAEEKGGQCLSEKYAGAHTIMKWECSIGHQWQASFNNIKRGNSWCARCSGKAPYDIGFCVKLAKERGGECLSVEYKSVKEKLLWRCNRQHQWRADLDHILNQEQWCPDCRELISNPQREVYNYIRSVFPKLKIILNDTKTIKPMHLDVYIPELKLAIEYDGWYFHHSEWAIEKGMVERNNRKNQLCIENKIKLLRINGGRHDDAMTKEIKKTKQKIVEFINNNKEII